MSSSLLLYKLEVRHDTGDYSYKKYSTEWLAVSTLLYYSGNVGTHPVPSQRDINRIICIIQYWFKLDVWY